MILAVGTATYIGDKINQGVYHVMIENKQLPLLEPELRGHHLVSAEDVMAKPCVMLNICENVGKVARIMASNAHHGFAVVEFPNPEDRTTRHAFRGIVLRSQLEQLLNKGHFHKLDTLSDRESLGSHAKGKRRGSIVDHLMSTRRAEEAAGIDNIALTEDQQSQFIKLDDVINIQPPTVNVKTPFQRLYDIFLSKGLRHLPVIDDEGQVVGMITRKDLFEQVEGVEDDSWQHGREFAPELFDALDTNRDGKIDESEWSQVKDEIEDQINPAERDADRLEREGNLV